MDLLAKTRAQRTSLPFPSRGSGSYGTGAAWGPTTQRPIIIHFIVSATLISQPPLKLQHTEAITNCSCKRDPAPKRIRTLPPPPMAKYKAKNTGGGYFQQPAPPTQELFDVTPFEADGTWFVFEKRSRARIVPKPWSKTAALLFLVQNKIPHRNNTMILCAPITCPQGSDGNRSTTSHHHKRTRGHTCGGSKPVFVRMVSSSGV